MKFSLNQNTNKCLLVIIVISFINLFVSSGCYQPVEEVEPYWTSISYDSNMNNIQPGVSYFKNQYTDNGETREDIVYIAGNLPLVISVPHGGYYDPDDEIIPERDCNPLDVLNPCARDKNSQEIARELEKKILEKTNGYAHVIYNKLHRSKLDANRKPEIAYNQSNNPRGKAAWEDFQFFIDLAKSKVAEDYQQCLYIDLHGQRVTSSIIIGYHMTASELHDDVIESDAMESSSLWPLYASYLVGQGISFDTLVRGEKSFGSLLYSHYSDYQVLPSQKYPDPSIDYNYIGGDGSYNLNRHCVNESFYNLVSGMQLELHGDNLGSEAERPQFCAALASALNDFLTHYGYME